MGELCECQHAVAGAASATAIAAEVASERMCADGTATPARTPFARLIGMKSPIAKHPERLQKDARLDQPEDVQQLDVPPLTNLDDRINNPDDIEPDEAAMRNGPEHGGTIERRAAYLSVRGTGGRKRS